MHMFAQVLTEDEAQVLAHVAQQLEAVGGARGGAREADHPGEGATLEPADGVARHLAQEAALAAAQGAVQQQRPVSFAQRPLHVRPDVRHQRSPPAVGERRR